MSYFWLFPALRSSQVLLCNIYNSVGENSEGGHMLPPGSSGAVLAAERVRRDPHSCFRSAPRLPELHRGCLGTQRLWVCKGSEQGARCQVRISREAKGEKGCFACSTSDPLHPDGEASLHPGPCILAAFKAGGFLSSLLAWVLFEKESMSCLS